MASRNFNRKQALEKEIKELYALVSIGASGAPTLSAVDSLGVASIARNSAGLYTLTLQDKYVSLKHIDVQIMTPSAENIVPNLVSEDVDGAKTIQFRTTTDGVATDPASGDKFYISIQLKNTTAK